MPTQLQLRRGNTAQTATFTGAVAEITVDTDKKTVVVHDGTTAGGFALALETAQLDQFAFTKANLAFDRANSAFAQANAAYDTANTKFNSAGGTISGNVIVTGNVTPTTDNVNSLGSASKRWKDLFVGPGSINIDGIVIGNNGGQIVISGASDFVFQSTTGAPSVSTASSANIALNAFNQANLAYNQANTSYGSFAQANLAYNQANSGFGVAVSAFAQANLAFTAANNAVDTWVRNQANAAYDAANSAVTTGQANVGAGLITVTSAYQANVGAGLITEVAARQANVGASVITLSNNITNVFNQANLAFNAANSAVTTGQANVGAGLITVTSAYQANAGAGLITEVAARQANIGASVITLSNNITNVFNQANLAFNAANNAVDTWVRNQANSAYDRANSSFAQANLAYTTANAALPKVGGTITGDLTVSGNLVITGATTTLNVTSLSVTDTLIQLGTQNQTDLLDIGFVGHYANTPNNHTGLIRKYTDGKYYLFDNWLTNTEPTNNIDIANTRVATLSANLVTNVITLRGLDPLDYSNTIYSNAQANTGAAVISLTSAYQANTGAAALAGQANVGAGLLAYQTTSQANVGAGLITVTNNYQANVGAGLLTKLNLTGGTVAGNITVNSVITNNSIYSPVIYSTGALSRLDLSDIGLVGITVAGQTFQFGGSGIESSPGIFGGSFGGNRLSLNSETNLISNRLDIVKIQTGTGGSIQNEWSFANNQLIFPDTTIQNTAWTGADVYARNTANLAYTAANSAVTTGQANVGAAVISVTSAYQANVGASIITVSNNITNVFNQANLAYTAANTAVTTGQANVGAGLITVTTAYQANVGSAIGQGQANVGAAVISLTSAYQANAGAGLITVTNNYQANVGAVNIAKVNKAGDVMTGALSTSGALIGASLTSNTIATINTNAVYESTAVTTAAATQFTLDSFSTTAYRSAKYLVQISSGSAYELLELALIHDGTTVYLSQYGNIKTGATLGVFDATISTGTLSLLATPNNAVTTFKTAITLIPV